MQFCWPLHKTSPNPYALSPQSGNSIFQASSWPKLPLKLVLLISPVTGLWRKNEYILKRHLKRYLYPSSAFRLLKEWAINNYNFPTNLQLREEKEDLFARVEYVSWRKMYNLLDDVAAEINLAGETWSWASGGRSPTSHNLIKEDSNALGWRWGRNPACWCTGCDRSSFRTLLLSGSHSPFRITYPGHQVPVSLQLRVSGGQGQVSVLFLYIRSQSAVKEMLTDNLFPKQRKMKAWQ